MEEQRGTTVAKGHVGRFQILIWKRKRTIRARSDFDLEREVEMVRVCIHYGKFNRFNRTWENQSIWCDPDELRDLANVLDNLN